MGSALGAIALWATLATLATWMKDVPPFLLVGCGLLVGSVCGLGGFRSPRPSLPVLALGVYGLFAYHFCLFVALRLAPPVEANLLNYLWPLLIVLLTPLFIPGTVLRAGHLAGAVLAFSGALLLVAGGLGAHRVTGASAGGYGLALAAAVIWSTYSLLSKRLGQFPTSTVATFCWVSGLLSLLCHFLFEPSHSWTGQEGVFLLVIGLGPMGAAFYLWDSAMKKGDPRVIGTLAYLTPLLSTLILTALGGGQLGWRAATAMALILGGAAASALTPSST